MAMRPKTRKRLIILSIVLLALGAGITAALMIRSRNMERWVRSLRADGLAAYESGDYRGAIRDLGRFMKHHGEDPDTLYVFAQARMRVPAPGGSHIAEALNALKIVVKRRPDNLDARQDLLKLFVASGRSAEAIELADETLLDPEESEESKLDAIRALAVSFYRKKEYGNARKQAEEYTVRAPTDINGHILYIQILRALDVPAIGDAIEDHLKAAEARADLDPRIAQLVYLLACRYLALPGGMPGSNRKPPEELLEELLADPLTEDPDFMRELVDYLRMIGQQDRAVAFVRETVEDVSSAELLLWLVQRLWEGGEFEEMLERLDHVEPLDAVALTDYLAYKALALIGLDRPSDAEPYVKALERREKRPRAVGWARYLRKVILADSPRPQDVLEACRDSLFRDPGNLPVLYSMGTAYASLGETELAIKSWLGAAREGWKTPILSVLRLGFTTGQFRAAEGMLEGLKESGRFENELKPIQLLVAAAKLRASPLTTQAEFRNLADELAALESPGIRLPARVDLLRRAGDVAKARELLEEALQREEPFEEATYVSLARACSGSNLPGAEDCFRRSRELHGLTPSLAFEWAGWLAGDGKVVEGRNLIEEGLAGATDTTRFGWELAKARYLSLTADSGEAGAWITLCDKYQDEARAQALVLRSRAVWKDREFVERTIENLKRLTGEEGHAWRVAQARLLFDSGGAEGAAGPMDQRVAAECVSLLADVVREAPSVLDTRLMMAQALRVLGDQTGAIEHLKVALGLAPTSAPIALDLARLLGEQGDSAGSRELLLKVARSFAAEAGALLDAASQLLGHGMREEALDAARVAAGMATGKERLRAASLLRRCREPKEAEETVRKALAEERTSDGVLLLAELLSAQGRKEEADQLLNDSADILSGTLALMTRAAISRRTGDFDSAIESYRDALRAEQGNARAWRSLAATYVAANKRADARSTLAAGVEAVPDPDDNPLKALTEGAEFLDGQWVDRIPAVLLVSWIEDEANRLVSGEALRLILQEAKGALSRKELLAGLKDLASRNRKNLVLLIVVAERLWEARWIEDALSVAGSAMHEFPQSPAGPQLLSGYLLRLDRWGEAITPLKALRERDPGGAAGADLMIAQAMVRRDRPRDGTEWLVRHYGPAEDAELGKDENLRLAAVWCQTLLASGAESEAREILEPQLGRSADWRRAWIDLAARYVRTLAGSLSWFEAVREKIPEDAFGERLALISGLASASRRFKNDAMTKLCQDEVDACIRLDLTPSLRAELALVLTALGMEEDAIEAYRKALESEPGMVTVGNNLAVLLMGGDFYELPGETVPALPDLEEGLRLAEAAVKAGPDTPDFHDTLALAHFRLATYGSKESRKHRESAIRHWREALKLAPERVAWRVRLGRTLLLDDPDESAVAEARLMVQAVDLELSRGVPIPPVVLEDLAALKDALR